MKKEYEISEADLQQVLQRINQRRSKTSLPDDFTDRVLGRLQKEKGKQRTVQLWNVVRWAVAASIVIAVGLTLTLRSKDKGTLYQDTFASAEEACVTLGNDLGDNTIAL